MNHRDQWRVKFGVFLCSWLHNTVSDSVCVDVACLDANTWLSGEMVDCFKLLSRNLSGGTEENCIRQDNRGATCDLNCAQLYCTSQPPSLKQLTGFYGGSRYLCRRRKNRTHKHCGRYSMLLSYLTYQHVVLAVLLGTVWMSRQGRQAGRQCTCNVIAVQKQ